VGVKDVAELNQREQAGADANLRGLTVPDRHRPPAAAMRASTSAWTEQTWNSVTGCPHGDAERMALRLHAMNAPGYAAGSR